MFLRKLTTLTVTLLALAISSPSFSAPGDVLSSFPINNITGDGRAPTTPQGITFHNGYLYIVDFGTDRIYRTYPEDILDTDGLTILNSAGDSDFNIPLADNGANITGGGGLTFAKNFLWNASPISDDIIKVDPVDGDNLESENTLAGLVFPSPTGMTFDGTHFWIVDWQSNTISKVLAEDGSVLSTIPAPSTLPSFDTDSSVTYARPFGIAWDSVALWVSDHQEDKIYRIDPADGTILASFNSPASNPKGLTWDGEFLWLTDQSSATIYKLDSGVIPSGILGCVEKNGVPMAADALLSQQNVSDQVRTLDSQGCFLFDTFTSGVEINLAISETGVDEKPTITLAQINGSSDISIELGGTYVEPGYSAIDPEDGDITANVVATPDVINSPLVIDTSVLNDTGIPVTYDVIDSAGNAADTQTRLVFITPVAYSISGNVSGLNAGESITITNNGADSQTISSNAAFSFPTEVVEGLTYNVQVATQPTGQTCNVTNGAGTASADVTNVQIDCSDISYNISVNASGLDVGDILVVSNNGITSDITANGTQVIATATYNSPYDVQINTPPANKTCAVGERSDTPSGNALSEIIVDIECQFITYTLGGTLTGLEAGDTPSLRAEYNTVLTTLTVDGPYVLNNTINSGSSYTVTLNQTPTNKNCTITGGTGTATADVTDIIIDCVDNIPPAIPTIDTLVTNNTSPTITGTAVTEAGDTLSVIVSSATYNNVIVSAGLWSLDTSTAVPSSGVFNPLSDGTYDIIATLSDAVGNLSSDASSDELRIDTVAPAVPTVNALITNIVPPTPITGTATLSTEEALSVTINGATYSNVAANGGNWSINLSLATPSSGTLGTFIDGNSYEVVAAISDVAGNTSPDTSSNEIIIDQTAPAAPATPDLTAATDTGSSNTDNITQDTTPDFTGVCTNGEIITLYVDGGNTGATQSCSTGNYTITTPTVLSDGAHAITTTATDIAGNESAQSTASLAITIDASAPTAPTVATLITNDTSPVLSGTATLASGESLTILINGVTYNSVAVVNNNWSLDTGSASPSSGTFTALTDNVYNITATTIDTAGNTTEDSTSGELTIDTVAPTAPTVNLLTTNDLTPTITGTATLAAGETLSVTINGASYNNVPTNSNIWNVDTGLLSPDSGALGSFVDGSSYEVVATATDTAGNSATDTSVNEVTIDATPPVAPTVDLLITNNPTPVISGTASSAPGETLSVEFNGARFENVTVNGGLWSIDTATATPSSGTLGALIDGNSYEVVASARDTANLVTSDVTSNEVTFDQTAPAAPGAPDMTPETDRGQLNNDNITSDNTPTVTGTCTDTDTITLYVDGSATTASAVCASSTYSITATNALTDGAHNITTTATDIAGNEGVASSALATTIDTSAPTAPSEPDLTAASDNGSSSTDNVTGITTPEFAGTCTTGDIVSIYVDGINSGDSASCAANTYSVTLSGALNNGAFAISARSSDIAGNISTPSTALTITVDTSAANAPAAPDMTPATDTGANSDDNITADTTPVFTGSCTNADTIALYVDGVASGDNAVCASSTYVITMQTPLLDGNYTITATATGASAVESPHSQAALITIDTTAPAAPGTPDLTSGSDTGISSSDNITAETFPILSGTCTSGETVTLYLDGLSTSANDLCAAGVYTIATPNALISNNYLFTATTTDIAGNQSAQSTALSVEVDTIAPSAPATPDLDASSDTGLSSTDNITSDTTPLLTGSCTTGDTIKLYVDNSQTSASTLCSAGTFSINTPDPLTNGAHNIGVTATDAAGNSSSESTGLSVTIDTGAPLAPTVDSLITNNTSPTLTGAATLGGGESLSVSINGSIYNVSVNAGIWTLDTSTAVVASGSVFSPLTDNTYNITATVTDTAGNASSDASVNELIIDTTAPLAPAAPDLVASSDTGSSSTDNITSDATPTFSGACTDNETITLYVNTVTTGTTSVCAASAYSLTAASSLSNGSQTISITSTDLAGNESSQSASLSMVVDTTPPSVPSVNIQTTNDTSPVISGSASLSSGDTLSVSVNGASYDNVTVTTGSWSIDLGTVTPSSGSLGVFVDTSYNVTAVLSDIAGNTATDTSSNELTIDTTAPSVLSVTDMTAASDTGLYNNDNITSNTTPTFTGSCSDGDTVSVYVDSTLNTSGTCSSATYSITATTLAEGARSITVTASDTVGNESGQSLVLSTIIDTTAPNALAITDMAAANDSGSSSSDNITNNTSPAFVGSCSNNDTVNLVVDTLATSASALCSGSSYSLVPPTSLGDGSHAIAVTATDLAGNTGAASVALNITIDTTAPGQASSPDLDAASDTGTSNTDNITSDTSPAVSGACTDSDIIKLYIDAVDTGVSSVCSSSLYNLTTPSVLSDNNYAFAVSVTDPAGNEGIASAPLNVTIDTSLPLAPTVDILLTNDTSPVITGSATTATGDVLEVSVNGASYDNVVVSAGVWSVDTQTAVPTSGTLGAFNDGSYNIIAALRDAAGNVANDASTNELTIDTTPPTAPSAPDMTNASDTGSSNIDNVTRITTPDFSGSCTNGETIALYIDASNTGATAVCSSNSYTVSTPSALTEGAHLATVTTTDLAGNESAQSGSVSITLDTTSPLTPSAPNLTTSSDSGASNTDNVTNETIPSFDGSCNSGEAITLYINNISTDAAFCVAGSYALSSVTALTSGNYNITVSATDLAGNESTVSSALAVVIDTGAPASPAVPDMTAATDTGPSNSDNITNIAAPDFTGSCTNGETIALYIDGAKSAASQVCASNVYSLSSPVTIADGSHAISISATDIAGNEGSQSAALSVTIDTTAPTASTPDLTSASDSGSSNSDDITNDATPSFAGTCNNGETITLFVDGASTGLSASCANSAYNITASTVLTDGSHSITTTAQDIAGNTGAQSSPVLAITIDTNQPSALTTAPDMLASSDSGASNTDNVTNVVLPSFTGSCTNGELISLVINSNNVGATDICASSTYTLTAPDSLINGNHAIGVTSTDTAGNESLESPTLTITIDTGGPNVPSTPDMLAASDSGSSSTDNITNVTSPSFSGTCSNGDSMRLYVNGSSTTSTAVCSTNSYTLTPPTAFSNGTQNIAVTAEDSTGNESSLSVALTITVDTIAVALAAPDLTALSDTGSSNSDNITNDTTPSFSGACSDGESVALYVNGTANGTPSPATCSGSSYSITTATALSDATHTITVVSTDIAGNVSAASPGLSVVIDSTNPATPTINALTANTTTPTLSGTASLASGDSLNVEVNGASYNNISVNGGNWSLNLATTTPSSGTLGAFVDGTSYEVVATITDNAGNSQIDTSNNELTMDTEVNITLSVSGYNSASALVVSETVGGGTPSSITANGSSSPITFAHGANYTFSITGQPSGQACQIPATTDVPKTSISGSATTDTTVAIVCANITETFAAAPAQTITSNNGNNNALITETTTIVISEDRQIADLNVYINMTHTYAGDVSVALTSPSGTTVMLIERPGSTAPYTTLGNGASGNYGCSGNNIDVTLDDEGTSPVENSCGPVSGTLTPNNPLSTFDGESSLGTWTLTTYDSYGTIDGGTLNNWSLEVIIPTL